MKHAPSAPLGDKVTGLGKQKNSGVLGIIKAVKKNGWLELGEGVLAVDAEKFTIKAK